MYSMIFKTFNSDIDSSIYKIGVFDKSFGEIIDKINDRKADINGLVLTKGIDEKEAKKQVGSIWSYLAKDEHKEKLVEEFNDFKDIVNDTGLTAKEAADILGDDLSAEIHSYVKTNKDAKISTEGFNAAIGNLSIGAKAGQVALKGLKLAGNLLASWAFTEVLSVLYKLSQVSGEVADKAKEMSTAFADTQSSIDEYKTKVSDLYATINDNTSSVQDVTDARKQLLSIQDEMIEKYGTEKEVVNNITDAINGETEAWDNLSDSKWQDTLNKFDDRGFIDNLYNLIMGYDNNIDQMLQRFGDHTAELNLTQFAKNFDYEKLEKFENILRDIYGADVYERDGMTFADISGQADEVYEKLLKIQSLDDDFDFSSSFSDDLRKAANEASNVSDKFKDLYNQYTLNEKIFPDSNYKQMFSDITDAYKAYEDAFASNDQEKIKSATDEYAKILTDSMDKAFASGDEDVANYFRTMYPTLQSIVDEWEFHAKIIPDFNTNGLQGKSQGDVLKMLETDGLQEGEETFNNILDKAKEYGIVTGNNAEQIQQLLDLLSQWGILQKEIVEIANNEEEEPLEKWNYMDTLSHLKETKDAFTALDSAYSKLFDNDKISGIDFDDLTAINEKFSDVSGIDTYIKRIQEAGQNTEQVKGVFEDLIDAYIQQTGILENVTEDNKDLIASYLEEMGVANALELVENALAWQTDALAAEKEFAAEKGIELVNATADEINAFVDEKGYSEQTRQELLLLALQKEYVNQTALDFSGDLTSLMSYMTALGSATTALQMFNNAKNGTGSYSGKYVNTAAMSQLQSAASSEVEKAISNAKSQISKSKGSSYNPNKSSYKGGSSTGKNKSGGSGNKGGSSSKSQEDTYEKEIDWYEKRVKKLDALINTLKADIENVLGSVAKNQLVERQLTITEEKIKNTSDALSMYEEKAASALAKVPSEFRDKVMNGAVALTDFIGKGNEDTVEAIENYQTWADKLADVKQNLSELKETMRELELEKFNNIIEEFTNKFDIHDQAISNIDKQISLFEEMGLHIGTGFYNAQISEATKQLEHLQQEKEALVKQMNESVDSGRIDAGSDQWLKMVKELSDLDGNILDCKTDIEKFNNSIQQVHWDNLDELSDRLSGIKSELENIASLLEDEDVIDDNGNWTVEAITRLGLAAQQYEEAEYRVKKYSDEIDGLNKAYLEGKYSADEYAEKLQELKNAQWDAVNDSESAKDAIISINEERIDALEEMKQKEIDAMQEVIDKRKEELDAEKDLADYREQLAEKTKSVTDLDRQIAAMSGDTTASTVAKRKKLEAQRAEAQKNLDDFNRDHAIDTQKEALDKQLEDFTNEKNAEIEALKATLDDKNALYQQSFELVKANASTIADELDKLSAAHGVTISKNITDPWKAGQNAIAGYGVTLTTQTSVFTGCLDIINSEIQKDQSSADELSKKIGEAFAQKSDNLCTELDNAYNSAENLNNLAASLHKNFATALDGNGYSVDSIVSKLNDVKDAANNAADAMSRVGGSSGGGGSSSGSSSGSASSSKKKEKWHLSIILESRTGKTITRDNEFNTKSDAESWLARYQNYTKDNPLIVKGDGLYHYKDKFMAYYAKGVKRTKRDELAITQDPNGTSNTREMIVSPSTGQVLIPLTQQGMLTSLRKGDSVLPNKFTENIWSMGEDPSKFIAEQLKNNPLANKLNLGLELPKVTPLNNLAGLGNISMDNRVIVQGDISEANAKRMQNIAQQTINTNFEKLNRNLRKVGLR